MCTQKECLFCSCWIQCRVSQVKVINCVVQIFFICIEFFVCLFYHLLREVMLKLPVMIVDVHFSSSSSVNFCFIARSYKFRTYKNLGLFYLPFKGYSFMYWQLILSFYLSEKHFISPSVLKTIFSVYRIICWPLFFSFRPLKTSFHYLLTSVLASVLLLVLLRQGLANYGFPVYINKVILEHSDAHLFMYYLWLLSLNSGKVEQLYHRWYGL